MSTTTIDRASIPSYIQPDLVQMPSVHLMKDPAVREWALAFMGSWNQRNGLGDDENKFLTRRDVQVESLLAISQVFTAGVDGLGDSAVVVPTVAQVQQTISNLQDEIRKSLIYQYLENAIGDIDLKAVNASISSSFDDASAQIGVEQDVRSNKDNALASAINQIWAQIGGSTAVIQDGALAAVTPSGASATKWTQVVSAVTDPNTGLVNSTSIKQDLNTYANSANNTFNAIYSVRAQVSVGGQTVVGGFGLSATSGAGSAVGATIDFGVRADKFFIAATSATPDGTTQENAGNSIPFMVLTSTQFVNGVLYSPGVFIKQATIGTATIGTAKIADAAITNAKIGGDIASTNFVNGVSGWYLSRGGYFECNNIYARGNILATSLTANTVTADQVVSDSLNQFYTTTSGAIVTSNANLAKAIKITSWPGYTHSGGNDKDSVGATGTRVVQVFFNGADTGARIYGSGTTIFYNVGGGTHTWFFRVADSSGTSTYTGRVDLDMVIR